MKKVKEIIKIDKRIPIPDVRWATKNPLTLAMMKMKNGDSFIYPLAKRAEVSISAKKAGIVVATRTVDPANVRVWRIKERPDKQHR